MTDSCVSGVINDLSLFRCIATALYCTAQEHGSGPIRTIEGSERTRPETSVASRPGSSFVSIAMKKLYSALILSALALLAAGQSQAAHPALKRLCGEAPAAPQLIEGTTATRDSMVQVAGSVRGFADQSLNYLSCLDSQPASTSYMAQPSFRAQLSAYRDQVADRLEMTVNAYNAELRDFKAQQAQVAQK